MKKISKLLVGFVAAISLLAIPALSITLSSSSAYAVDERPAYRMDITPGQDNLKDLKPGDVRTGKFSVENTGTEDFSFSVDFTPYSVEGEDYDPNYEKETQYNDIAKWMTTDITEATVKSGEEVFINYTIKVPADAHGGLQAGVIMVTMQNADNQESTGFEAIKRLGFLVFGNVDGNISKNAKILENNIPGIIINPDLQVSSLVENNGNVYGVAEYKVQIFPLFSDEEVYTNEEKPEQNVIFPETKRYNAITWEETPSLGIYRVRQTVKLFDEESIVEKLVFIIPLWLIIVILVIIFLAVFWIVSRIHSRKKK